MFYSLFVGLVFSISLLFFLIDRYYKILRFYECFLLLNIYIRYLVNYFFKVLFKLEKDI